MLRVGYQKKKWHKSDPNVKRIKFLFQPQSRLPRDTIWWKITRIQAIEISHFGTPKVSVGIGELFAAISLSCVISCIQMYDTTPLLRGVGEGITDTIMRDFCTLLFPIPIVCCSADEGGFAWRHRECHWTHLLSCVDKCFGVYIII
jgi:hypothetical protein